MIQTLGIRQSQLSATFSVSSLIQSIALLGMPSTTIRESGPALPEIHNTTQAMTHMLMKTHKGELEVTTVVIVMESSLSLFPLVLVSRSA
jgi:hypothetical protein